ncbi:MAG: ABC transporter ATP-binding protein [Nitrospinales bacterium]
MTLLTISNLITSFDTEDGKAQAVRSVDIHIDQGETVALVGESGCGKSVTALSVMRLIPQPPGRIESGEIIFNGKNLLNFSEKEMQKLRGNEIGMIFQEPMTSLNPIFTVGDQVGEAIALHQKTSPKETRERTLEILRKTAIPSPEQRIDQYPHELSGGMKQRIMIAMAIACKPKLLIADEPTTALDVTIEAQILDLLGQLQDESQMSILLITHNLGIVAEYADRVGVMYAGKIVEEASVEDLFKSPSHPYTKGLLNSLPSDLVGEKLIPIQGTVPNPTFLPSGCAFHPRCEEAMPRCKTEIPPDFPIPQSQSNHKAACWLYAEETASTQAS